MLQDSHLRRRLIMPTVQAAQACKSVTELRPNLEGPGSGIRLRALGRPHGIS
jgi:hypothetical protein